MEGKARRKSQCMVSQQSLSSSFPLQVKDRQARKPSPAPQPSAMPQELPGSTPTEPVSSKLCLFFTHPAPSHRRKQPVRGDLCFRKARSRKLPILYVYFTYAWTCSCTKTHINKYGSTRKHIQFVLVTDAVFGDIVISECYLFISLHQCQSQVRELFI